MESKGVFITGPSRSGTSMVAGCIGVQGFFWTGPLKPASKINPRGFWESIYFPVGLSVSKRVPWQTFMRQHAYPGGPWMVKAGPEAWERLRDTNPLVVRVWRPKEKILDSRRRAGWASPDSIVEKAWDKMEGIGKEARCIDVYADEVAAGNLLAFHELFNELDMQFYMQFSEARAMQWLEPNLYSR